MKSVFLSAEADRQAVPLPASPSVAVVLCVRVSAVRQSRVADQRRVVEALHVELGSVLRRDGMGWDGGGGVRNNTTQTYYSSYR